MKLFLAGNFPLMSKPEEERRMKDYVSERGFDYNRLVSFFYDKGAENVLGIKEEVQNGSNS